MRSPRNKISVVVPSQSRPAVRIGSGYVQVLQSSNGNIMLAQFRSIGAAYVVSGSAAHAVRGTRRTGRSLGYPTSDASAGGTQIFAKQRSVGRKPRSCRERA